MYVLRQVLFCGLSWLGLSTAVHAKDELALLSTMNVPMSKYGMSWQNAQVRVKVKNLAYEKSVTIIFSASDGAAVIAPAAYFGPAENGYEVWEAWTNLTGAPYTFKLEFAAAGQSFSAGDFELKAGPALYAEQNVQEVLSSKKFYGTYANFVVALRNLGWQKNLAVHYSCDGFLSEQTVPLRFQAQYMYGYGYVSSPTPEGYEIWSGSISEVPESCGVLTYYYTYDVNGERYADTNFGHNYVIARN